MKPSHKPPQLPTEIIEIIDTIINFRLTTALLALFERTAFPVFPRPTIRSAPLRTYQEETFKLASISPKALKAVRTIVIEHIALARIRESEVAAALAAARSSPMTQGGMLNVSRGTRIQCLEQYLWACQVINHLLTVLKAKLKKLDAVVNGKGGEA